MSKAQLRAACAHITVFVLAAATSAVAQAPPGPDSLPTLLISRQLADARRLEVGDSVHLSADPAAGRVRARAFRVAGIYEPTPDPARINAAKHEARLHLPDLLSLTAAEGDVMADENVDAMSVAVKPGVDVAAFARELSGRVPGVSAVPVQELTSRAGLFVVLERFHLAIALVTIVASTVFLLALTVMLVDERRETVGVLRLIGFTSRRILVQVCAEGLIIAGLGALFGIVLALASQGIINRYFQWRYDTALVFVRITPDVAWQSLAIAVPLGVLGSVLASWALLRRGALTLVRR
jgi:putative ABC transport system permease protein